MRYSRELRAALTASALALAGCATAGIPADRSREAEAAQPGQRLRPFAAIYRRGPNWAPGVNVFQQPTIAEHIVHHEALGERLVAAGPLMTGDVHLVGIVIILAGNQQDASAWLKSDPAIRSGVLSGDIGEWRLSAIKPYRRP